MQKKALSIAVLSGKGGVGKTNLTLNLALALEAAGEKVLVIDGDLGLANIDVLLGITPEGSLQDFLAGTTSLESVLAHVSDGLDILPAASGSEDLVTMTEKSREYLAQALEPLLARYDFVFLDLGAGISANVRQLSLLAEKRLLVTTPEPTALTDCYALMKILHSSEGLSDFWCITNNVQEEGEDALTRERLGGACSHFLGFVPDFLGCVHNDPAVNRAVCQRIPFLKSFPDSQAAADIRSIAERLRLEKQHLAESACQESVPLENA